MAEVMIRAFGNSEDEAIGQTIAKAQLAGYPNFVEVRNSYCIDTPTDISGVYKVTWSVEVIYSDELTETS